jgi:hypothetical protein
VSSARPYGWEVIIDLQGCNPEALSSKPRLTEFLDRLCTDVIAMRRFGQPLIEWFGSAADDTDGYTVVQLIEWSSVVGHFSRSRRAAHLNVLSCRPLSPDAIELFAQEFFGGTTSMLTCLERGRSA